MQSTGTKPINFHFLGKTRTSKMPASVQDDGKKAFNRAQTFRQTEQWHEMAMFLEVAARKGHREAIYQIARCYKRGQGVKRSSRQASVWMTKALDAKHPSALFAVAAAADREWQASATLDRTKFQPILKRYQEAAEAGNPRAYGALGFIFMEGFVVDQDSEIARDYLEAGRRLGDPRSMFLLGKLILSDDLEGATELFRDASENGAVEAFFYYALSLKYEQRDQEALMWFHKAAQANQSVAYVELGWAHEEAMKFSRALYWYRRAAGANEPKGLYALGCCYAYGRCGLDIDFKRALPLLQQAKTHSVTEAEADIQYCEQERSAAKAEAEAKAKAKAKVKNKVKTKAQTQISHLLEKQKVEDLRRRQQVADLQEKLTRLTQENHQLQTAQQEFLLDQAAKLDELKELRQTLQGFQQSFVQFRQQQQEMTLRLATFPRWAEDLDDTSASTWPVHKREAHGIRLLKAQVALTDLLKAAFQRNSEVPSSECCVCLTETPVVTFKPCGHHAVCRPCSEKLDVCPLCRARIVRRQNFY